MAMDFILLTHPFYLPLPFSNCNGTVLLSRKYAGKSPLDLASHSSELVNLINQSSFYGVGSGDDSQSVTSQYSALLLLFILLSTYYIIIMFIVLSAISIMPIITIGSQYFALFKCYCVYCPFSSFNNAQNVIRSPKQTALPCVTLSI